MRSSLILLAFLAACSTIGPLDLRDTPTFALSEVRGDTLGERIQRGESFVVRVKQGDQVPVKVSLELPGVTFQPGQNVVRFDRDVFVHYSAAGVHVSPDGQTWAQMGDFKGMARLFGLGHGGTFQVGVGVTKDDGPIVSIQATAK